MCASKYLCMLFLHMVLHEAVPWDWISTQQSTEGQLLGSVRAQSSEVFRDLVPISSSAR